MNLNILKRPYLNSFILGVLIGLPQGLTIIEKHSEILIRSKNISIYVVLFGLFAPSILTVFSMILPKDKGNKNIFPKYIEYIRPNYIVIWMAFSLSITSSIMIYKSNNENIGYEIPLFFGSAGIGFLIAFFLSKNIKRV